MKKLYICWRKDNDFIVKKHSRLFWKILLANFSFLKEKKMRIHVLVELEKDCI